MFDDGYLIEVVVESFVLLSCSSSDNIAVIPRDYFSKFCLSVYASNYLCPANKFHFFPVKDFNCILNIAVHSRATPDCKFRKSNNKTVAAYHSSPYTYLFSKTHNKFTISCGGEPHLKSLQGSFSLPEMCGVYSPNVLTIFPSQQRHADVNFPIPHFDTMMLHKIVISEQARNIVTTQLAALDDVHDAGLKLEDLLQEAHPYVSFVGLPLFIVITIIVLILVGRCIFKTKMAATVRKIRELQSTLTSGNAGPSEDAVPQGTSR